MEEIEAARKQRQERHAADERRRMKRVAMIVRNIASLLVEAIQPELKKLSEADSVYATVNITEYDMDGVTENDVTVFARSKMGLDGTVDCIVEFDNPLAMIKLVDISIP